MIAKNMKSTRKQIVAVATCGVFLAGLVMSASLFGSKIDTVQAQAADTVATGFPCSNRPLKARYGMKGEGLVPSGPPPAPFVPFAVVGIETLDGEGNVTDAATTSLNGVIAANVNPGTYSVNEDCTGTYRVSIPTPPFQINHHLVIVDKGNEFYLIATSGGAVTIAAKRLD